MLSARDSDILRSQLSFQADMVYNEEMSAAVSKRDYAIISMLNIKPYKDGVKWCFLYGDNIQDGVAGFGDTPFDAMIDFNAAWFRK